MISTMQAEEIGSGGFLAYGVRPGAGMSHRWIPATFTIWMWLIVFLMLPNLVPRLHSFEATTWSGDLLLNSLSVLVIAALLPIYLQRDGLSVSDLGFASRPLRLDIVQGCAVGASIYAFSIALFIFLIRGPEINLIFGLYSSEGAQSLAKDLSLVMLAPVVEEVMFRACIVVPLRACWGRGSFRDALIIVLSGIAFACAHLLGHPLYYVGYFLIGAAFAVFYQRTGSLRAVMIAHASMNASVLTLSAILR
jgi:membrane protease YdiL (CAAX protease family)